MKVALRVSLIFLLNLIILHDIVAKPVDDLESKNFTTSTDKTDLETFTNQSASGKLMKYLKINDTAETNNRVRKTGTDD